MAKSQAAKVLVVDVGGTHVKVLATGQTEPRRLASGPQLSAEQMVAAVREITKDWAYNAVAIGYPGPVQDHQPVAEPHNLGVGWVGFDYARAFGKPVKMINDAAMQALGSYERGRMLFLGLGTGLGSALVVDGIVAPLELAHLPYRKGKTFEDYVGARGFARLGKKKWREHVAAVVALLRAALQAEDVVIGGGDVKKLKQLPTGARMGDNANAFIGGYRLWQGEKPPAHHAQAWRRPSRRVRSKATD